MSFFDNRAKRLSNGIQKRSKRVEKYFIFFEKVRAISIHLIS